KNPDSRYAFRLGLDLSGGSQLTYGADVSQVSPGGVKDAMASLRDVIERRINLFGVAESTVQVEQGSFATEGQERLLIELPGITDIEKAIAMIGQTPRLEFKTERPEGPEKEQLLKEIEALQQRLEAGEDLSGVDIPDPYYVNSELTGKYLKSASVDFNQA